MAARGDLHAVDTVQLTMVDPGRWHRTNDCLITQILGISGWVTNHSGPE